MIGTAKAKPAPFETLLLWKFSRFARNQEESIVYKALLRNQCGVDVVSVSEPLPGGTFSTLIERIIEWFDEFYSIRLSQEVKRTMSVKAERGEFQSSPAFGYRARIVPGEKTVLEPVPEEAELIREIFHRFVAGQGVYQIARWLNAQNVRTHRGNPFENRTVEYILRNPVYIGKLRWTPTGRTRRDYNNPDTIVADAAHEPLIDMDTWQAAQDRMAIIKATWGYKARPTYELKDWLGGVVRCSECGSTLIFAKPHYFKCNNYARGRCRSSQHVKVDLLHEAVLERLREDADSALPLDFSVHHIKAPEDGEPARLDAHLADLRRRQSRLLDAYLGGVMELDTYKDMHERLSAAIEETERSLNELRQPIPDDAPDMLRAGIRDALSVLESPDRTKDEKNIALRSIVDRITFDKAQNTLDIAYRSFFD